MGQKQTDCFKLQTTYWKLLAIWPGKHFTRYYKYYSKIFVAVFVLTYNVLLSINFYFLPRQMDLFIEDMLFYFTEIAIMSKVLTVMFMHDKIENILEQLECDAFQPESEDTLKIVEDAKKFTKKYWKIIAGMSYTSNLTHVLSPLFMHIFLPIRLELPINSYSFLSETIKQMFIYPLYFYQSIGMHFHMLYCVNIDTFFLGLLMLTVAQLEVLDYKLRRVTDYESETANIEMPDRKPEREEVLELKLRKCFIHFNEIEKLIRLVEDVFSVTMFVQMCMSSCIICVASVRFTMPVSGSYLVFLISYTIVMVVILLVPCWYGSNIMIKSSLLSVAIYDCDWTSRSRHFKSNVRLFVERMKKPLSLTGFKMFPLSLATFTTIMNSAYSFFTLLRHMQTLEY